MINSGVAHNHASGDYRTRRAECERAASMLGVPQLRDLASTDLERVAGAAGSRSTAARATWSPRTSACSTPSPRCSSGDLERLGALFYASHASQRDDYEVSVPEVDLLVG